jgi:hypothetical protein
MYYILYIAMTSLLKTLNKNSNNAQSTKFNPDVPNLYNLSI